MDLRWNNIEIKKIQLLNGLKEHAKAIYLTPSHNLGKLSKSRLQILNSSNINESLRALILDREEPNQGKN